jgi:glycine amidinotransferase
MIKATMPSEHHASFRHNNPFPSHILQRADEELDQLVSVLKSEGVQVCRPKEVDWNRVGGYTGAMPRDGLLTVGNQIIKAPFAWGCRS